MSNPLFSHEYSAPIDHIALSMMFGAIQNFDSWKNFFGHPTAARLGLLGACYQIGSVCSIPFVPMIADRWGRKPALAFGFIVMTIGGVIQGAAQNWGSMFSSCT